VTESRRREVESLGADGLVPKPLQIDTLVDRICAEMQRGPHEAGEPSTGK
jgi:DNA-binding response OmpR family regulator